MIIVAVFAIIITLILVVGIHEAGHALVARIFKVTIKRISIGFGRPIMQWKGANGCEWVWAIWPLGGYVQLANTRISPVDPKDYDQCFDKKPVWIRVLILLAGAFANMITAWIAFILVFYIGVSYRLPQIQSVQPNSVAARAGILPGDQFIAIAGRPTPSWQEVGKELVISWGAENIPVTMAKANKELKEVHLDLSQIKFSGRDRSLLAGIGLVPNLSAPKEKVHFPSLGSAVIQANDAITHLCYFFMMILKQLFSGIIPFSILLGPLGLFSATVASFTQGMVVFLYFIANLSVAVAVVNLFPIPGLDGGLILYSLIEKVRGKPISIALEVLIHQLVLIATCVLLVQLLVNDLSRFYN